MNSKIQQLLAILCLGAFCSLAQAQWLSVDQLSGTAEFERNGARQRLSLKDPLLENDVVRAGPNSRLSVRFSNLGFIELGAGAEIFIERLPSTLIAPDLRTALRLRRGFLRVVWSPSRAGTWPLLVRFGQRQANLTYGEYFFDAVAPTPVADTACVASGQIDLAPDNASSVGDALSLRQPRCYRFESGGAQSAEYTEADWVALRNQGSILPPHAPAPAPASAPAPANISAPVPTAGPENGRKAFYQIENAPPSQLLLQADTVPLSQTTTETLFGQKEPDLSAMLVAGKPNSTVTAVAPKPSTPPAPTGWMLQVASLATAADAELAAKKLRAAGYNAEVITAEVNGRTWHRVRIGYATAADARKASEEINSKLGFAPGWITRAK